MAYAYFTQYFFTYNNQACRIGMLNSANDPTTYNDGSRIQGSVSNAIGCHFYTKSGTVRTYYLIVFFENQTISNMPPKTYYQNDPGGYYMAFNTEGVYGSLTVSGVTYVYCQIKTHTYDESTQKYYSVTSSPFDISTDFRRVNDVDYKEIGLVSAADDTARLQCLNSLLNEQPSSGGQGTATLTLKPPAQLLTFESLLYGKSIQKWVNGDCEVNFGSDEPVMSIFNIALLTYYRNLSQYINKEIVVDQTWTRTYGATVNAGLSTRFLEQEANSYTVKAKVESYIYCAAMETSPGEKLEMSKYNAGDQIVTISTSSSYDASKVIIASTIPVTKLPFEICFMWHYSSAMVTTIIKRDGTKTTNSHAVTGEFIQMIVDNTSAMNLTVSSFSGTIKIFKNNDAIISMDASSGYTAMYSSITPDVMMIFAIPNADPSPTVNWEVTYEIVVDQISAAIMIDSDWNTELVQINGSRPRLPGFNGQLITIADATYTSKQAGDITANIKVKAKSGSENSMPSTYTKYAANETIANTSIGNAFARVTIASKASFTYNYEMCFVCRFNGALKWWIIMPNGTLVPHIGSEISGYRITSAKLSTQYSNQVQIDISAFSGTIKWYRLDEKKWLTRDGSSASTLVEFQCILFIIPS